MPTLGLLEADVLYDDLIDDYQSYGTMLAELLCRLNPALTCQFYDIHNGELPEPGSCDAYLVTGSKTGVYDEDPWLAPLAQWIEQAYARGERLLGICFGHQMLAHSLGGHAANSPKGWGVGHHTTVVQQRPLWLNDDTEAFQLIYSHRDQVESLPPGAHCLAGSTFCPLAAWYLSDKVLSFQGHPEFTAEYFTRLLERRREDVGNTLLDQALESIHQPNDSERIARWMLEFIQLPKR
ncbi:MAG: hypothetical protein CMK92_02505 [Pseudomonas sp.]|nr:hypothetical protein [Pseudomonas sp.]